MRWSSGSVRLAPSFAVWLLVAGMAAGDVAYVTCQNGEVLSVIDLDNGATQHWPLPGKPAGVVASPLGIFTVSPDSKEVRRLNPDTGETLARIVLDGGPIGVALDARRGRLFVSDWYNARIWVLGALTLDLRGTLDTGAAPAGLALSRDGRVLASADRDADQVSVFDAQTLALLARHPVGTRPFGLGFAPDGRLFVGNVGSDDVTVLDPWAGPLATVPVGARPYGVAFARGRAFVSNQYSDTVSVIDLADLAPVATLETGEYPEGIDATADGARIVVANWFENSVTVIDAVTLSVLQTWQTGDGPRAFGAFLLGGEE